MLLPPPPMRRAAFGLDATQPNGLVWIWCETPHLISGHTGAHRYGEYGLPGHAHHHILVGRRCDLRRELECVVAVVNLGVCRPSRCLCWEKTTRAHKMCAGYEYVSSLPQGQTALSESGVARFRIPGRPAKKKKKRTPKSWSSSRLSPSQPPVNEQSSRMAGLIWPGLSCPDPFQRSPMASLP